MLHFILKLTAKKKFQYEFLTFIHTENSKQVQLCPLKNIVNKQQLQYVAEFMNV